MTNFIPVLRMKGETAVRLDEAAEDDYDDQGTGLKLIVNYLASHHIDVNNPASWALEEISLPDTSVEFREVCMSFKTDGKCRRWGYKHIVFLEGVSCIENVYVMETLAVLEGSPDEDEEAEMAIAITISKFDGCPLR